MDVAALSHECGHGRITRGSWHMSRCCPSGRGSLPSRERPLPDGTAATAGGPRHRAALLASGGGDSKRRGRAAILS